MSNITVSEIAKEVLYQTIKESRVPSGRGLRLEESKDGLALTTDAPSEADRIIKKGNSILVIVNKELEKKIGRATIDISSIRGKCKLVIIKDERGDKTSRLHIGTGKKKR
jgi:hypothetical protein